MNRKPSIKSCINEGDKDEIEGMSLNCLALYGRIGGCKISAEMGEVIGNPRRRLCRNEGETIDCFSYGYGMKEKFRKKNNRKLLGYEDKQQDSITNVHLPDDILEMCLVRLPFTSLIKARLVCRKWKDLTTTPRFVQMRMEGLYRTPWLFLFGVVKNGFCLGEIHALDVTLKQWHKIDAQVLKGRFLFSVTSVGDDVYIVGGRSSLTSFGKVDRSSFKTHKGVLVFNPSTTSWSKAASMKCARSSPILGISEVSHDCSFIRNQQNRTRVGGISDVYEDPHRLSLRRQCRHPFDESESDVPPLANIKPRPKQEPSQAKEVKKFVLIAVGGLGSWDEPLDSGELYDPMSNKWIEIQRLPLDFGVACSGVVCNRTFYIYSESDKLAGYDIERGYWIRIQTTPCPPRVHEYHPKVISCNNRLFVLSVSWCEGEGGIGRRNKAVRKLWELDLEYLTWRQVSTHPDAPMDWNASFIADENLVFGVEMFKIFGQVLDFVTMCDVSDPRTTWSHISGNHFARELDTSSCMTKTMAALRL